MRPSSDVFLILKTANSHSENIVAASSDDLHRAIVLDAQMEFDRLAAHRAILDVIAVTGAGVDQRTELRAAIRAIDRRFK